MPNADVQQHQINDLRARMEWLEENFWWMLEAHVKNIVDKHSHSEGTAYEFLAEYEPGAVRVLPDGDNGGRVYMKQVECVSVEWEEDTDEEKR